MDLRAEPIVLSVPAVQKPRYYSVQLIDGNTRNYGYIGRRAPGRHQEGVSLRHAIPFRALSHPDLQPD
ncbi:DUF1254 domain-containing protein [Pseudomonas sp. KB_15]|uniref:DUF1254 domain-containing protein n=1 Tax=Pseudomonas sp. KB_15 TaxID=3233035 RepID=UPI003F9590E7